MKDQPLHPRPGGRLWHCALLATAALLLPACMQAAVRSVSVSVVTAVVIAVTPARVPPATPPAALGAPGCVTEQNWQQYTPEELRQLDAFCIEVAPGRTATVEQAAALGAIRQLFGDPALHPDFQGVASMPNAPNGGLPAVFFDDDERRYWVDLETGQVVEVDALGVQADWAAKPLAEAELRARAEQFVLHATPEFASLQARLAFQSGSKDGVLYFYRWEDRDAPGWTNMPPLAQVGITVSGRVVAYLNTLFLTDTGSGGPATHGPVPTPSQSPPALVVSDQVVYVRGGPGTDYELVGQLTASQAYNVMGQNGDWWLIALGDGRAGWVLKDLVAFSGDEAAVQRVDAPPTSVPAQPGVRGAPIGLPLALGTRWVYAYSAYEPTASDPTQIISATYRFTETVVDVQSAGPYFEAHVQHEELGLDTQAYSQSFASSRPADYWYLANDRQVFKSAVPFDLTDVQTATAPLAYDFPLSVNKGWCPFGADPKDPGHSLIVNCDPVRISVVEAGAYQTSLGRRDDCYQVVERSNSGAIIQWFCDGIGLVALKYDHSGTRFGFTQTLIDFQPGSP